MSRLIIALICLWLPFSLIGCGEDTSGTNENLDGDAGDVSEDTSSPDVEPEPTPDPTPEPTAPAPEPAPLEPDASPDCVPTEEVCDGLDNDCDGETDEAQDVIDLVQSDPENCGACGVQCAAQGAEGACLSGECVLIECKPGRIDLDGDASNGCEKSAGEPQYLNLSTKTPSRVVSLGPYYAVLDGDALWLYSAETDVLLDSKALPGAMDAAYDEDRGIIAVAGEETFTVLSVEEDLLHWQGWFEAPGNRMRRVVLNGSFAYVANNFNRLGNSRAFVFDISDPSNPTVAHREASLRGTTDLAMLDDDHLVTVSASTGLSIYDVSRPSRPVLQSYDRTRAFPSKDLVLDRERELAYVASSNEGVNVFDVSNPFLVRQVTQIPEATLGNVDVVAMYVEGNNLWLADYEQLRLFDMTNVNAPRRLVNQYLSGVGSLVQTAGGLKLTTFRSWSVPVTSYNINGGSVYSAALGNQGVALASEPVYEGIAHGSLKQLHKIGDQLLTIDYSGQVVTYEPQAGEDFQLGESLSRQYLGIWDAQVVGDKIHAITSSRSGILHTADYTIFEPAQAPAAGLVEVSRFTFDCLQSGVRPYNFRIKDTRAFVICGGYEVREVQEFDVSEIDSPTHVGVLERSMPIYFLETTEGQLITSTERRVLSRKAARIDGYRFPIADIESPNWFLIPDGLTIGMRRHGSVLYLRTEAGLQLLDVSIQDGFVEVELPALPAPVSIGAKGPELVGDHLLLPTKAGLCLMSQTTVPFSTPKLAGQLTQEPFLPTSAVIFNDTILVLEERQLVAITLAEP